MHEELAPLTNEVTLKLGGENLFIHGERENTQVPIPCRPHLDLHHSPVAYPLLQYVLPNWPHTVDQDHPGL